MDCRSRFALALALVPVLQQASVAAAPARIAAQPAQEAAAAPGVPGDADRNLAPAAAYIEVYRQLEEKPTDMESRLAAARLALTLESPALALDHASFAIARLSEGATEAPFLRLAALAHEAMGEPAAAWNCLNRVQGEPDAATRDLDVWRSELAAQFYEFSARQDIARRATKDLASLDAADWSRLWRAATLDPAAVEAELDRRLPTLAAAPAKPTDLAFQEGFLLRSTLWLARRRSTAQDPDRLAAIEPWLARGEALPSGHDLRVVASLISILLVDQRGSTAHSGGTAVAHDAENPAAAASEIVRALREAAGSFEASVDALRHAGAALEQALSAPESPGPLVQQAIAASQAAMQNVHDVEAGLMRDIRAANSLSGGDYYQAELAFDAAREVLTKKARPAAEALRAQLHEAPQRAVEWQRRARNRRMGERLSAARAASRASHADAIALTDELIVWSGERTSVDARGWELRIAALMQVSDGEASGRAQSVRHAEARCAAHDPDGAAAQRIAARQQQSATLRSAARLAYEGGRYDEALRKLGEAIQRSPMDETLLELRWRWLDAIAGPVAAADALLAWWPCASPLDALPNEEMELLYRAGAWGGLLSVSEAAMTDWPLSSVGFRFHAWAGAALDLPDAEQRVDGYLQRSEQGKAYLVEKAIRDALGPLRRERIEHTEWMALESDAVLKQDHLDGIVVALAMRRHALGVQTPLIYVARAALKSAPQDPLRDAFRNGDSAESLLRIGDAGHPLDRAAFFAAAAASTQGDAAAAARLWKQCADAASLPPTLRTQAARELAASNADPLYPIRQRDAVYTKHGQALPTRVAHGRLLVARGPIAIASSSRGAMRFLGMHPSGQAALTFPGDATPLAIVENAVVTSSSPQASCGWIARGVRWIDDAELSGPIDAVSCAIDGRFRVAEGGGAPQARIDDVAIGRDAHVQIARPTTFRGLVADASNSRLEVVQGGTVALHQGMVDAQRRVRELPWLTATPEQVVHMDTTLLHRSGPELGYAGPGVRTVKTLRSEAGREIVVANSGELHKALAAAEDGDRIRLTAGAFECTRASEIRTAVVLVGAGDHGTELRITPTVAGTLRIRSGGSLTLQGLRVMNTANGYSAGREHRLERIHVHGGGTLVLEDTKLVLRDRRTVTVAVERRGVVAMQGGVAMCRFHASEGSCVAFDGTWFQGAWCDGDGQVAVHRLFRTTSGVERLALRGATVRVTAGPDATVGGRAGSPMAHLARACCELRWADAEAAYDTARESAASVDDRAAAAKQLANEMYAAGRVAWADVQQTEERFFRRLKPLLEADLQEAPRIASELPYYFPSTERMMRVLNAPTRKYIGTHAKVSLQSLDRLDDHDYLTQATEYELAYPLQHPDRSRAMKLLANGLAISAAANAIAAQKAEEARVAAERRRRVAAAERARVAAVEAARREQAERYARDQVWSPRPVWRSSYPTNTYVAAPSSYQSSVYRSNVDFYSRLNSIGGGGSYTVSPSGVTYGR